MRSRALTQPDMLVQYLRQHPYRTIGPHELWAVLYGDSDEPPRANNIRVAMCAARKRLTPPERIVTTWRRGYQYQPQ